MPSSFVWIIRGHLGKELKVLVHGRYDILEIFWYIKFDKKNVKKKKRLVRKGIEVRQDIYKSPSTKAPDKKPPIVK